MAATPQARAGKGFQFPSAFTILIFLTVVVAILTWFIPAGQYERDDEGKPIAGSYQRVEKNPQRLLTDTLLAPIDGMYGIQGDDGQISASNGFGELYGSINVAMFVLVIGGFLGVTMKTGAIDVGIKSVVKRLGSKGSWLIVALMVIFLAGGTSYGMAEETLAFYVVIIAAIIGLGYDSLTGVALIMLGAGIGTLASTVNPFATGIASGFAGIPLGDGLVYRLAILLLGGALGIWYVLRYAKKVQKDPARSLVADMAEENRQTFLGETTNDDASLTGRQKAVLALFMLAFLIMVYSVIPWSDLGLTFLPTLGWWFPELTALFFGFAVVIGLVGRMGEATLTDNFIDGARDLLGVALVVAVARGISVVMNNGLITDTVLYWAAGLLSNLSQVPFIIAVYFIYLPLSFLIPSSSGLATVTMPIMAPLAEFADVPTHLVVTAYQSASGLVNLFTPTFAVVAGGLALGRVPLDKWWRFVLPLVVMLALLTIVVLTAGVLFA